MASHLTGSDKILEIRTAYIDLIIKCKGRPAVCTWETGAASSSLRVIGADLEQISVPVQSIAEKYAEHKGITVHEFNVLPLFFEQTDYVVTIQSKNGEALQFRSNNSLVEESLGFVKDDDPTLLNGVINYGSSVGYSDLTVMANGKQVLSARVEVYPTKLSYKDDYQEMMADINNMVSESVLDFMKKTYQVFVPDHKRNDVPAVFFTILQSIYDKYLRAANRILAVPHHKLITEHEVMPHYKATRTDIRSEKWLRKHPEYVRKCGDKILAERILAVNKQITYDTQENRLVKFMLQSTVRRIEIFSRRYQNSTLKPDENILAGAARMSRELRRLLSTTFLAEVSERNAAKSMSLVFGMAPGYRELYKYYLMLQNGISVGGDVFHMSVRDTAQLYEYWCFIKLYDILRGRYTLKSPDIIKVDRKGVTVDLVKGKDSNVVFLNPQNGELIKLTYNQSESKTQTVSQRPDNILELEKKGSSVSYKYVFDAKYRIEMNPDSKCYPDDKPGPKVDDINTMHRYRDSIVYANPSSRFIFEKTMFGAYILFPYAHEKEYTEHKFYKSIETVNIGGLPFLPSATSLVTELLDELVTDSPEAAFERATLPVGIEERLRLVDWSRRDVLIGLVPDDAHLKLYTDKLMYFTPRLDIAHLPVRYVALYEKGKGISRYGEVVSWRRAARGKLPGGELSRGAHKRLLKKEPYSVFEVLKWHTLETPISIAEYGPSPIAYTNFFLLSNCSSYSELFLKNEDEYRFFAGLKRMTDKAVLEDEDSATAFEFDGLKVLLDKKEIYVMNGEKLDKQDSLREFVKHPNRTFKRLMKYREMMKGKA